MSTVVPFNLFSCYGWERRKTRMAEPIHGLAQFPSLLTLCMIILIHKVFMDARAVSNTNYGSASITLKRIFCCLAPLVRRNGTRGTRDKGDKGTKHSSSKIFFYFAGSSPKGPLPLRKKKFYFRRGTS